MPGAECFPVAAAGERALSGTDGETFLSLRAEYSANSFDGETFGIAGAGKHWPNTDAEVKGPPRADR